MTKDLNLSSIHYDEDLYNTCERLDLSTLFAEEEFDETFDADLVNLCVEAENAISCSQVGGGRKRKHDGQINNQNKRTHLEEPSTSRGLHLEQDIVECTTCKTFVLRKAWHLAMYASAAIFGIANYVSLQNTMAMVDNKCVLFPRELAFRKIDAPESNGSSLTTLAPNTAQNENGTLGPAQNPVLLENVTNPTTIFDATQSVEDNNTSTESQRLILDTSRTLFGWDSDCQFAEYMPIVSMIFAATWATMFTMCPGGGHSRSGLQQPWRILPPALLFAFVMVGLTGHNFTSTNRGLQMFCSAFYNVTNTTTCSSVGDYLESSQAVLWGFGSRAIMTRVASAAVWASWACAAALFLARCLAAPDFKVRRTSAYLTDPQQIITPYLKKSIRRGQSTGSSAKPDNYSIRSEPTVTTELVIASIEQENNTAPPSLEVSPFKKRVVENIEMTTAPNGIKQE